MLQRCFHWYRKITSKIKNVEKMFNWRGKSLIPSDTFLSFNHIFMKVLRDGEMERKEIENDKFLKEKYLVEGNTHKYSCGVLNKI